MQYKINGYQPEKLFHFFEDISAIPRGSGNEKAVSDYIVKFAADRGLRAVQDEAYNVIVYKDGSKGAEDKPPVILQGHIDMVDEKVAGSDHDFEKDGIDIQVKDGWATANGTPLGADDGSGAALILYLLDDDTQAHPPIEAVFTTGEEIGFVGASQLDFSLLKARRMINIDSEDEGIATVSCAGGMEFHFTRKFERITRSGYGVSVRISGLSGGHSGTDIDLGRTNAIKLAGRAMNSLPDGGLVADFNGGTKDNAIPREASFTVLYPTEEEAEKASAVLQEQSTVYDAEILPIEPGFLFQTSIAKMEEAEVLPENVGRDLLYAVRLSPNGVQHRDPEMDNAIDTSLNLGVVRVGEDSIRFTFAPRSSVDSLQEDTVSRLQLCAEAFHFNWDISGRYPGWEKKEDSVLRETFEESYNDLFQEELQIEGIHAGLECGLFAQNLEGLDAISVGPTLRGVHTPDEAFDLVSCEKVCRLISEVLARLSNEQN